MPLYKITLLAHVDMASDIQKSEVVIHALTKEHALKHAERAKHHIGDALHWHVPKVHQVEEMVCTCPTEEERNQVHPRPSFTYSLPTRFRYCAVHGTVPFTVKYESGDPLTMELHRRVAEAMGDGE